MDSLVGGARRERQVVLPIHVLSCHVMSCQIHTSPCSNKLAPCRVDGTICIQVCTAAVHTYITVTAATFILHTLFNKYHRRKTQSTSIPSRSSQALVSYIHTRHHHHHHYYIHTSYVPTIIIIIVIEHSWLRRSGQVAVPSRILLLYISCLLYRYCIIIFCRAQHLQLTSVGAS